MVVAVEEQSALLRVAMLVARGMRLEELFAHVCEESARLLGVDATGVLRYIGGERAVVVGVWRTRGARGLPVNAELDFDQSDSAIGRALATKAPARVSSYDHARGELPAVMRSMGMSASVATPVLVDGEPWGAIVATAVDEEALPPGCEQRLMALAELVAQAVANDRRWEELAASRMRLLEAGDETRRRLESGLHEGAHQHVGGARAEAARGARARRSGVRGGRGAARRARRRDGGVRRAVRARARPASGRALRAGPRGGAAGRRGAERAAREPARTAG